MTPLEVEIDVFSGMPNPTWTLSDADAELLLTKLSQLEKTTARPRSTKLGYRGLVIRTPQEGAREIYIGNGVVELRDQSSVIFLLDPERSLERWLIEKGKQFVNPQPYEAIEKELQN